MKNKPAIKARRLGEFEATLKFNQDSTYNEIKEYFPHYEVEKSRKWQIKKVG